MGGILSQTPRYIQPSPTLSSSSSHNYMVSPLQGIPPCNKRDIESRHLGWVDGVDDDWLGRGVAQAIPQCFLEHLGVLQAAAVASTEQQQRAMHK